MNNLSLSIVIPAYNEADRIPAFLDSIFAYLQLTGISFEILVIDDGSTDRTAETVTMYSESDQRVKLVRLPTNGGKGLAVKTGMLLAAGDLVLFADADGATPIRELQRLIDAIEKGADVAIASRALKSGTCEVRAHLHRKVIGTIFNSLVRIFAVRGIRDTQCGFKLFTAEAARAIFPLQRIYDFGFDVEILFIAQKLRYSVAEVAVDWADVRGSKVSLIRDSIRMFGDIFRVRMGSFLGFYESPAAITSVEGSST